MVEVFVWKVDVEQHSCEHNLDFEARDDQHCVDTSAG